MDWLAGVDIYCERLGAGFWAEPVNALSNLSFLAAAFWAAVEARRRGADTVIWGLIAMAALIGVGSFLFHTFANTWSEYADTIPIWSFVAAFVFVAMQRIGGVKPGRIGAIALIVAAVVIVVMLAGGEGEAGPPGVLNGSEQYAPALIALLVFSVLSRRRGHPMWPWIWAATGVFCLSLFFRTIDMAVCPSFAIGSHFVWHLLNGVMVGLLLQMLLRAQRPLAR
ncbi:ceramidase domain-containing protein [Pseudorhodobacter sp. W20_MBD10_FR17]|uniref:ceramidase domain-containing protein n=1 Tax=Pseudorhodobacter sp. W20_MBD10_FR17 TaxID=3240266 RepID=UPI003F972FF0